MIPGSGPEQLNDAGEVGTTGGTGLGVSAAPLSLSPCRSIPCTPRHTGLRVPHSPATRLLDSSPSSQARSKL